MNTFLTWFIVSVIIMLIEVVGTDNHRPTIASAMVIGIWSIVYFTIVYAHTVVWLPKVF